MNGKWLERNSGATGTVQAGVRILRLRYHGWTGSVLHGERSGRASNSECRSWCDRHPPVSIVPRGRLSGKYRALQK